MSLKGFHVVFITAAIVLAAGMAWWCFAAYRHAEGGAYLGGCLASLLVAATLATYETWFLRKSRRLT